MAYAEHVRVSFGGAIVVPGEPTEVWNCNVNGTPRGGTFDGDTMDALLAGVAGPLAGWFSTNTSRMASNARLDYIKANVIGADGLYTDKSTTHTHNFAGGVFGASNPVHPSIISCCFSWTTAHARGIGAHGRIYPPNWAVGTAGSLTIDIGTQHAQADVAKALLVILSNVGTSAPGIDPVVASAKNASLTPITGISVGNVLDVQRRRKNKYNESYYAEAYP